MWGRKSDCDPVSAGVKNGEKGGWGELPRKGCKGTLRRDRKKKTRFWRVKITPAGEGGGSPKKVFE